MGIPAVDILAVELLDNSAVVVDSPTLDNQTEVDMEQVVDNRVVIPLQNQVEMCRKAVELEMVWLEVLIHMEEGQSYQDMWDT